MDYFLLLDADYPPGGGSIRYLARSQNAADLLVVRRFALEDLTTVPCGGTLKFVASHDVSQMDAPGTPQRPAAIYEAL